MVTLQSAGKARKICRPSDDIVRPSA